MVAGQQTNYHLIQKVEQIYSWLDLQIHRNGNLAGACDACGQCCDFTQFDHRLFVTPPELIYLAAKLGEQKLMAMKTSRCPYNENSKCTIYDCRFAGCRIFCCKADKDFQSRLSESALKKLKATCTEFEIPYCYTDLAAALNSFVG